MNERVENVILEHMRAMRGDMGKMSERLDVISAETLIIRQHMAGLLGSQTLHDHELATVKARLGRNEKRLELVD